MGAVLSFVDQTGASLNTLMDLVVGNGVVTQLAGSDSNNALVKLAYRNLLGSEATDDLANSLATQFLQGSGGTFTKGQFLSTLAGLDFNLQHIGLVGTSPVLLGSGLEYI